MFNRRASRSRHGKVNDPALWVWSTVPAHEPLIPKWMFDELNARRQVRRGPRDGNDLNVHPETTRTYVLRAMLFDSCGRRMNGNYRHNAAYYMCWPKSNNRGRSDKYVRHPKVVYIREDAILDALSGFYGDRVFGVDRRAILAADLATFDDREALARDADRERLQRTLVDLVRRQNSVMRQAQDGDPDDPFTRALRGTYNDLDAERAAALPAITSLDAADKAGPARPDVGDVDLLNALPLMSENLTDAPEPLLRTLFEATSLTVKLTDDGDHLTISIRIPDDTVPEITRAAEIISEQVAEKQQAPGQSLTGACADGAGAPGRIRTCAPASGGRCSIP